MLATNWEKAAGGKMSFDVASVRPAEQFKAANIPLGSDDAFTPTGSLFRISAPASTFVMFAYRLFLTNKEVDAMLAGLPAWVKTQNYAIEARGPEGQTKDQIRLMMQSLLAERFGLKVHIEDRDMPVLVMTIAHRGKLGPDLHLHSEGPSCDRIVPTPADKTVPTIWPLVCKEYALRFDGVHPAMVGARDTTMDLTAMSIKEWAEDEMGRPLVNRTGLSGQYDFTLTWALNPGGTLPPESTALQGPTFLEAMREQLGIKLTPAKLPMKVLVIDHIEKPSEN